MTIRDNGMMVKTYSIADLLCTMSFLGNQTKLSAFLKIDRMTLRKYMDDINQTNHMIVRREGKYVFMCATNRKHVQ